MVQLMYLVSGGALVTILIGMLVSFFGFQLMKMSLFWLSLNWRQFFGVEKIAVIFWVTELKCRKNEFLEVQSQNEPLENEDVIHMEKKNTTNIYETLFCLLSCAEL